ncbi:hypothetical protein [Marinicella sp. W31]|uniref:hypothetical protein n=1 Tax=Marinicella sp. W31 TaxID=3023713 RepID=UPI003756BEB6
MFKKTLNYIVTTIMTIAVFSNVGHANGFTDPLTIHPQNIRAGQEFLIHINSSWNNGCRGEVIAEVTADVIDLTADPFGRVAGAVCTQEIVPFHDLINPYDLVNDDFRFADNVTVNFSFIGDDDQKRLVTSKTIGFSDELNSIKSAESGFWVSHELAYSSLTMDQQQDMLSLALSDFEQDGESVWYFAAGPVNGNIFSGVMYSYNSNIVCVTEPCPRAAIAKNGRVYMLINERNEVIAKYIGLLDQGLFGTDLTTVYQRLELQPNPELPKDPVAVPDLTGAWVAGVESDTDIAEFAKYTISYGGESIDTSGLISYVFSASITNSVSTRIEADFTISCVDQRPLDGPLDCAVNNMQFKNSSCAIRFPFESVANNAVSATADCSDVQDVRNDTRFVMYRSNQ